MLPLSSWPTAERRGIVGVFTDIDDTLTTEGAITPDTLQALAQLKAAGLYVIAITGRPVGWSLPFAASWPVDALVAENGAVALIPAASMDKNGLQPPSKRYQQDAATRATNHAAMQTVAEQVLGDVPSARLSRDANGRETDLAFDYAEFNQMEPQAVQQVLDILSSNGMHTSISSIHIHGCIDDFNKWNGACWIARELLKRDLPQEINKWAFVGDSGNDQVMFQHFAHSFGVANVRRFAERLTHLPRYITPSERGAGFVEMVQTLISAKS